MKTTKTKAKAPAKAKAAPAKKTASKKVDPKTLPKGKSRA